MIKNRKIREKKCCKCGKRQVITNFGKHSSSADGRQSYCNSCKSGLHKVRRDKNVGFRIKHHFATRIKSQLGDNCPEGMYKNLEKLLGYTFRDLRKYLDDDIKARVAAKEISDPTITSARKAMRAGWHIDHITPLHSFKCEEIDTPEGLANFRKCWRMENLVLISAEENLAKGGRIDA